ncbi:hypothetical protein CMPELA_31050 [Cupriavidus necator]|uniref:Uncharacterized protein n=1 Tax=Cupriavidus necator (strain ATCC 17699 / DSM 428 / KCTC 22496 / NCIMB 10442 / H16 / Stanier 337) TaxID=381666 RepID=Q0JYK9_CUPNH|nr:hypothetical protein [Cupriavidus necator]QCC04936.1 hypothetical protein E6A55_31215 [Cupriavidus necator H16]QQB79623.1 hypothetical protein I6H87_30765 [Cupriavidus necator]WKA43866.1 hypothetical protein QWP09_31245 [Cupriavidus necator]CAJ97165.1 Hypothetical protein H16_B2383 [Cupriavidus necator H16]
MTTLIQPPIWNSPTDAVAGLAPFLNSENAVDHVLVKVDDQNVAHFDNGPLYREARYVYGYTGTHPAGPMAACWYDSRTGLRLHNVSAWTLAE